MTIFETEFSEFYHLESNLKAFLICYCGLYDKCKEITI